MTSFLLEPFHDDDGTQLILFQSLLANNKFEEIKIPEKIISPGEQA